MAANVVDVEIQNGKDNDDVVTHVIQETVEPVVQEETAPDVNDDERYASLPLEERAFQILKDLDMVQENLDPDNPNYDSSKDNEFCS